MSALALPLQTAAYDLWASPLGTLGVLLVEEGVLRVLLDTREDEVRHVAAETDHVLASRDSRSCAVVRDAMNAYLAGDPTPLAFPVVTHVGTEFQRKVWKALGRIPRGSAASYAWLAGAAGAPGGTRAVGQANRANPHPLIVPCHRVVQSDGTLGGYAGPHTWMKELLLRLEGCPIELRRGVPVVAHDALWGAEEFMLHAR